MQDDNWLKVAQDTVGTETITIEINCLIMRFSITSKVGKGYHAVHRFAPLVDWDGKWRRTQLDAERIVDRAMKQRKVVAR